jgi:hypothetical protein
VTFSFELCFSLISLILTDFPELLLLVRTGFEEDKNFHVVLNSVIAGRYHVTEYLGSAAFSKAIQAHDLHTGIDVCVKIIKNNKDFFDQSLDEIKLLKYVNKHDPADKYHILRLYDYFYYRVSGCMLGFLDFLFVFCFNDLVFYRSRWSSAAIGILPYLLSCANFSWVRNSIGSQILLFTVSCNALQMDQSSYMSM